jgi:hypothetical protein
MAYNDVPPFKYSTLSATGWTATATNGTNIKTGNGMLHSITFGVATSGTVTFFDNVSSTGTIIAVVSQASTVQFPFDVGFANLSANCSASGAQATVAWF